MEEPPMPDLSHLSEDERKIIEEVLQRQKAEEDQEKNIAQKADKELEDIEKQINERKEAAMRLIGTQDDAICQICQKTKFADGIGHKCYYCQLRSCARCGGRTTIKLKVEPKPGQPKPVQQQQNKNIWACSLCQKRQQILAKTGKWFQQGQEGATTPVGQPPQGFGQPMGPPQQTPMGPPQQQPGQMVQQQPRPGGQPYGPGPIPGPGPPGPGQQLPPQSRVPLGPQQLQQQVPQSSAQHLPSARPQPGPAQTQNHVPHRPPGGHQPISGGHPPAGQPPPRQQTLQRQSSLEDRRRGEELRYQNGPPGGREARRTPPDHYRPMEDSRGSRVNGDDWRLRDRPLDDGRRGGPPQAQQMQPPPPGGDTRFPPLQDDYDRNRPPHAPPPQQGPPHAPPPQQGPPHAPPQQQQQGPPHAPPQQGPEPYRDDRRAPGYDRPTDRYGYQEGPRDQNRTPPFDDRRRPPPDDRDYDPRRGGQLPPGGPPPREERRAEDRRQNYTSPPLPHETGRRREMDQQRRYNEDYGPGRRSPPRGMDSQGLDYNQSPGSTRRPDERQYASDPHARRDDGGYRSDGGRDRNPPDDRYHSREPAMPGDPSRRTPPLRREDHERNAISSRQFRNGPPRSPPLSPHTGHHINHQTGPPRRTRDIAHPGASTIGPAVGTALPSVSQRAKLDAAWRTDSLSSEDQIRGPAQSGLAKTHHHHHHVRHKKPKMPKRHSLSSSDEEIPSTSECPSCDDRELESESFSEKGLLRYLYGSQQQNNRITKFPGDLLKRSAPNGQLPTGQLPVTWQPSADRTRLIGHMILHRHSAGSSGDLGFKVVGGRRTETGRLGAFITRVKKGSAADSIGHLKPGDEVLEWNGRLLQNATFEQVYQIISSSKDDPQVELIVSRPASGSMADIYATTADNVEFVDTESTTSLSDYDPEPPSFLSFLLGFDPFASESRTVLFCPLCCFFASTDPVNDLLPHLDAMALQQQQPMAIPSGLPSAALPGAPGVMPMVSVGTGLPPGAVGPHAPVLMVTGPADQTGIMPPQPPAGLAPTQFPVQGAVGFGGVPITHQRAKGQIFGRIQVALYYTPEDRQLLVTVHQAMDLPPRADGTPRNPYVKMFLLPDRSERSRRQSKVLVGTCIPTWQQAFVYQNLTHPDLVTRVLEVTLWDYDKFATNDFLGEVLIDLSVMALNNQPQWFTLTDMDEDSPLRMRVRQQRLSAYLGSSRPGDVMGAPGQPLVRHPGVQHYSQGPYPLYSGANPLLEDAGRTLSGSSGYRSDSGLIERSYHAAAIPRSHTYHRQRHPQAVRQDDDYYSDPYALSSGYYSDHGYSSRGGSGGHRRPRSATGVRPSIRDLRPSSPTERGGPLYADSQRHLPQVPGDLYGDEALHELDEKAQQLRSQQLSASGRPPHHYTRKAGGQQQHYPRSRQRALPQDPNSPPTDSNAPPGVSGGYVSDGSETSMSVTSTQSERPRARTSHEYHNSLDPAPDEMMEMRGEDGTMSDSAVGVPGSAGASSSRNAKNEAEKRKKSLMTRLIPGRQNQQGSAEGKKRLGFPRSEEVGIPSLIYQRHPHNGDEHYLQMARHPRVPSTLIRQQASVESGGSADSSWFPIHPEGPLGEFVSDLGPGQVVGRQVLASPCLGEIEIGLADKRGTLTIEIVRGRNLVMKHGGKTSPAPYVKVYLMEGKICVAKAKTSISRKTTEPLFQQTLQFTEPYQNRMLQITVWGDFGQMKRKAFMGIAQIRLDKLNLSTPVIGWYKLFHSSSLIGTGSPARKDSEGALPENSANAVNRT